MTRFKKVEAQNFLSFKKLSLDLDNRGLILIEGENKSNESYVSNGSGKTSSISAITYAIYGKTEKGLKADDVINRHEKKNTFVKLYFDIDKDHYRIERYRKDKENKNKVKLFLNDKDITGSTNDVTDTQIQELIGIEFNTYVNAIMFGQGDIPMFSQATDKGKKEILESITKTDVYKRAQEVAKEKVKEVEDSGAKIEQQIKDIQLELSLREEQYNKEVQQYEAIQERIKKEKEMIIEAQKQVEQKRTALDAEINHLHSEIPTVKEKEYTFPEDYYKAQENVEKINSAIRDKIDDKDRELYAKESALNYERDSLNSQLSTLDTSDTCPTCGAPLDNSHKLTEQQNIKSKLTTLENDRDVLAGARDVLRGKRNELLSKVEVLQQYMNTQEQNKKEVEQENYRKLQNQQSYYAKIRKLEEEKHNLSVPQLSDYSYVTQPDQEAFKEYKKSVKESIDKYQQDVLQLEDKKGKYKEAVEAFSNKGIRSVVLDFITPFLNEKANTYLQTLSGSDIEIEFQTQVKNAKGELKDKFDVIVKNSQGGTSYKANSAGEQKRIDLAISFAIQDLIMSQADISTNIALYDECFDGLDIVGCENVIKLLKDRLKTVGTIFVITHSTELKALFEQTMKVVKTDGVSVLTEGTK